MSTGPAGTSPRPFSVSDRQAQMKFKHARWFGVQGPYNAVNRERFKAALTAHVNAAATQVIQGRYGRGAGSGGFPALFYLDPVARLVVVTDLDGNFVTGFLVSPQQLASIQTTGRLGSGP